MLLLSLDDKYYALSILSILLLKYGIITSSTNTPSLKFFLDNINLAMVYGEVIMMLKHWEWLI